MGTLFTTYRTHITFFLLLLLFIFLRFYEMPQRTHLGWDQADSAWAAKSIIVDNPVRLQGVPIKGDARMFMGPLYYYLITPFYFFTGLDMIASSIFAGCISILGFCLFYAITKKIFTTSIAMFASFFYVITSGIISMDRIQAAYVLVPTVSYIIFYTLYEYLRGKEKYILYTAAAIGFGFHVHFTSIFYIPIVFCLLPFFPKKKKALLFIPLALLIFLLFISPMLYSAFFATHSASNGIMQYLNQSFHGFHLMRVFQLAHDGFISFQVVLQHQLLRPFVFFVLPVFILTWYIKKSKNQNRDMMLFSYMTALWIIIPWFILATYNGELTDYYFSLPRNLGIVMITFILWHLYEKKILLLKMLIISILFLYSYGNIHTFFHSFYGNYIGIKATVRHAIEEKQVIPFKDRDPLSFMYFVYAEYRKK